MAQTQECEGKMKDLMKHLLWGIHCCFWTVTVASPNLHSLCLSDNCSRSGGLRWMNASPGVPGAEGRAWLVLAIITCWQKVGPKAIFPGILRRPGNSNWTGRVQNILLPNTITAATTGASLLSAYPHTPPFLAPRYPPQRFVHQQPNLRPPSSARSFLPSLCINKKPCCPTLAKY